MGYGHNNNSGNNGYNNNRYDSNNRNNGGFHKDDRNSRANGNAEYYAKAETIKSPYNFVPLSDTVVFPEWADEVSHDIPFEDGISGKIDLEVKLKSDAYIRNGGKWDDITKNDDPDYQKFFTAKVNGEERCVIPGTSFKGMIRNVLEIASFGKMQNVNDDRYSIRDLQRGFYTNKLTEKKNRVIYPKTKAGWLCLGEGSYEDGEKKWQIIPCDHARIEQDLLGKDFGRKGKYNKKIKETAKVKYESYGEKKLDVEFTLCGETEHHHSCGLVHYKKVKKIFPEERTGIKMGTLVFTGQPSPRITQEERNSDPKLDRQHPKHMEFVFYEYEKESERKPLPVSKEQKDDFIFVNSNDNKKPLPEWEYWTDSKGKLTKNKRIPVFYLEENRELKSFGLAMMYRLPYDNTVVDTIKHTNPDHSDKRRHDMAELIFGYVNGRDALRGRVQFSHFISEEVFAKVEKGDTVTTIPGGPKPTYYPNYIKQTDEKGLVNKIIDKNGRDKFLDPKYKTFMDADAEIRGWKRYPSENLPVSESVSCSCEKTEDAKALSANMNSRKSEENDNSKVLTKFTPLKAGTKFKGSIRFFNLKPQELGALLWALDFGGNKNCQHKIGMGKPLGFGRISITLDKITNLMKNSGQEPDEDQNVDTVSFCKNYCSVFEEYMSDGKRVPNWKDSDQIRELLAMADINKIMPEKYRGYPSLKNEETGKNDFVEYKRKSSPKRLEAYSKMIPTKEAK